MAVFTVDQERMKGYIEMGFEKDDAYKMCKEEAEAMNKDAAKQAKAEANKAETDNNDDKSGESNQSNTDDNTKFISKDEVGNIVKDTIKGLKDDAEFKNFLTGEAGAGEIQEERTPESVVKAAVEKMRTGK